MRPFRGGTLRRRFRQFLDGRILSLAVPGALFACLVWGALCLNGQGLWLTGDDSFIFFIYARNLARGFGLVYNAGDAAPTEGFSSLLQVLLLALGFKAGIDPAVSAAGISLISFLAGPVILGIAASRFARTPAVPTLALAVLVQTLLLFFNDTAIHLGNRMDTNLFMVSLSSLAAWMLISLKAGSPSAWFEWPRFAVGVAVLSFAMIVRMEGIPLGMLALGILWLRWLTGRRRNGSRLDYSLTAVSAVFAAEIALFLLWKWRYFGYLLPNPYYVKSHNAIFGSGGPILPGIRKTIAFLRFYAPSLVGVGAILCLSSRVRRRWAPLLLVLLPGILGIGAYARVIHEADIGNRFEYPFLAFFQAAITAAAALAWTRLPRRKSVLAAAAALAILSVLFGPLHFSPKEPFNWLRWNIEITHSYAFDDLAGDLSRARLGGRASMMLSAAGMIPYLTEFRTLDYVGLNNNTLCGRKRLTLDQVWRYIDSWRPDVIVDAVPPATPGVTELSGEPAFFSPAIYSCLRTTEMFEIWDQSLLAKMFFRYMGYIRDHYQFGACYLNEPGSYLIVYVRRDSPFRRSLLYALRSSKKADWTSDLKPTFVNDPRLL